MARDWGAYDRAAGYSSYGGGGRYDAPDARGSYGGGGWREDPAGGGGARGYGSAGRWDAGDPVGQHSGGRSDPRSPGGGGYTSDYRSDYRSDYDSLYARDDSLSPGHGRSPSRRHDDLDRDWRPPGTYASARPRYEPRSLPRYSARDGYDDGGRGGYRDDRGGRYDDGEYGTPSRRAYGYGSYGGRRPSPQPQHNGDYAAPGDDSGGSRYSRQRSAPIDAGRVYGGGFAGDAVPAAPAPGESPRTLHQYSSFLMEEIAKTKSDNAWLQREIDVTRDDNTRLRQSEAGDDLDDGRDVPSDVGTPPLRPAAARGGGAAWRVRLRAAADGVFAEVGCDGDRPIAELAARIPGADPGGPAPELYYAGRLLDPSRTLIEEGLRDGDVLDVADPPPPSAAGAPRRGDPPGAPPAALLRGRSASPGDVAAEQAVLRELQQQEGSDSERTDESAERRAEADALAELGRREEEAAEDERREAERKQRQREQQEAKEEAQREEQRAEAERAAAAAAAAAEQQAAATAAQRGDAERQQRTQQAKTQLTALVRAQNHREGAMVLCYVDGQSVFKGDCRAYFMQRLRDAQGRINPADLDAACTATKAALRAPAPGGPPGAVVELALPDARTPAPQVQQFNAAAKRVFYSIWLPLLPGAGTAPRGS